MANHSPNPNNYQVSKTWDEAMNGEAASGEAELPQLEEAQAKTRGGGAAAKNGGGKSRDTAPDQSGTE